MYTIEDLNVRLLSELKDIAEELGVKNFKKLAKKDLIYKILDEQASNPPSKPAKPTEYNHLLNCQEKEISVKELSILKKEDILVNKQRIRGGLLHIIS